MLIERLSQESGIRQDRLLYFAETASKRYYIFSISKSDGGNRQIAHPARPLKAVQRWINHRYLNDLPVHDAAMAYRVGRSILANAKRHAGTRYTLRMDFKDFFPSFSQGHVSLFLKASNFSEVMDDADIEFVSKIVCRNGGLTIGAPSSPILTNSMMFPFDQVMANWCAANDISYTRYADDLFMSTNVPNILNLAHKTVERCARSFRFAYLEVNRNKTAFLSKKYKRRVTGLIITPDGKISVGRDRKREIKSLLHSFKCRTLPHDRIDYLRGLLSFVNSIEPWFIESMIEKYGVDIFVILFQSPKMIVSGFSGLEALDPRKDST